ncbi:hypothetical protein J6590_066973 [Homalodisca vitripennis]|nr:hypothetical protein J6590_066973 [Homalodisca vitripennis]
MDQPEAGSFSTISAPGTVTSYRVTLLAVYLARHGHNDLTPGRGRPCLDGSVTSADRPCTRSSRGHLYLERITGSDCLNSIRPPPRITLTRQLIRQLFVVSVLAGYDNSRSKKEREIKICHARLGRGSSSHVV